MSRGKHLLILACGFCLGMLLSRLLVFLVSRALTLTQGQALALLPVLAFVVCVALGLFLRGRK